MSRTSSLLFINIAVLLFGSAGLFAKGIALPAVCITFGRVFFSSLTLFAVMRFRKLSFRTESRKDLALLLFAGAVLALHWWSFFASIRMSTVAVGTITFSAFPLFVTLLEPLVFRTKLTFQDLLAAVLMILGVLITIPEFSAENSMSLGILTGTGSALLYSVLTLINRYLSERYPGTKISFFEQSCAAVVLLPAVLHAGIVPTGKDVLLLVILGIFMTALAHTLFISSLRAIPASLAGIISSMETVYSILLAFFLLGEAPGLREWIGAAVILTVAVYSQLRKAD